MKTLLISRAALPLFFLCVTSWSYAQVEHDHSRKLMRDNVVGYGTTLLSYQLPESVVCSDVEKLREYAFTFSGVTNLTVDSNSIDIQFDNLEHARNVELIFARMEILYLEIKPSKNR